MGDKKKRRRKKKTENGEEEGGDAMGDEDEGEDEEEEEDEDMEVTQQAVENLNIDRPAEQDSVFKVTVAAPTATSDPSSSAMDTTGDVTTEVETFWPSKRMNTALTVCRQMKYNFK